MPHHMPSAIGSPSMEKIMHHQACKGPTVPRPATLAMREDSHMVSKLQPKIRIVHIFAPEIIKTDVANFRELVQRLTGKPTKRIGGNKKARTAKVEETKVVSRRESIEEAVGSWEGYRDCRSGERIKGELVEEEEGELWGDKMNSGGLMFGGLGDIDGFLQGLSDYPLLPLNSSHMDAIGEAHVSQERFSELGV